MVLSSVGARIFQINMIKPNFLKDKKEILIPFAKKIQPSPCRLLENEGMIYKQRKAQNNYIRFNYGQAMPSGDVYEATDKDLNFISQLNNQS